ncbi:MAG TPA: Zn-ribbon domain-containing OB-fold protein [Dehalococcoidia bacterium]|nr:Zn-ribbon domain-containing OB-fold protein [Dehalococcoidia bacterium]
MTVEYPKPLPQLTDDNGPYLEGLRERELRLQRCGACGRYRYPPARFCPHCLSEEASWEVASGRGTLYSFIVVHQLYHPGFRDDIPYNVAIVELDEGPRITSNVVGCENRDLKIGMRLVAEYFDATPEATILKFRPA